MLAEEIAKAFHESYERQASEYGYKTRVASAVPWADVPTNNKALMTAVAQDLLDRGVIAGPDSDRDEEILCGCREFCGDLPEEMDRPQAICKQRPFKP